MIKERLIRALKTILKRLLTDPGSIDIILISDESLRNNQARWSSPETRLYVSSAAKTLLLDPKTFDAALE